MSCELFVGNLNPEVRIRDLENVFGRYGRIVRCDLKKNFGFVQFEDRRDAEQAMKKEDNRRLLGSEMTVEWAKGSVGDKSGSGGGFRKGGRSPPRFGGGRGRPRSPFGGGMGRGRDRDRSPIERNSYGGGRFSSRAPPSRDRFDGGGRGRRSFDSGRDFDGGSRGPPPQRNRGQQNDRFGGGRDRDRFNDSNDRFSDSRGGPRGPPSGNRGPPRENGFNDRGPRGPPRGPPRDRDSFSGRPNSFRGPRRF